MDSQRAPLVLVAAIIAVSAASAAGSAEPSDRSRSIAVGMGIKFDPTVTDCVHAREPLILTDTVVRYGFLPNLSGEQPQSERWQAVTDGLYGAAVAGLSAGGLTVLDGRSRVGEVGGSVVVGCPSQSGCAARGSELLARTSAMKPDDVTAVRRKLAAETGARWEAGLYLNFDYCDLANPKEICLPSNDRPDRHDLFGDGALMFQISSLVEDKLVQTEPIPYWLPIRGPGIQMGSTGMLGPAAGGGNLMTRAVSVQDPRWREAGIEVAGGSPEADMQGLTAAVMQLGAKAILAGCDDRSDHGGNPAEFPAETTTPGG